MPIGEQIANGIINNTPYGSQKEVGSWIPFFGTKKIKHIDGYEIRNTQPKTIEFDKNGVFTKGTILIWVEKWDDSDKKYRTETEWVDVENGKIVNLKENWYPNMPQRT